MNEKTADFLGSIFIVFFDLLPVLMILLYAVAAGLSATPEKWLIRATCWLIVVVARYLCREAK